MCKSEVANTARARPRSPPHRARTIPTAHSRETRHLRSLAARSRRPFCGPHGCPPIALPWILSSANLVQSRKNARFHPNLMAHSLKNQAYFSPSHTLIRKISRRGAEFSHPIDAKPCWSPCPWTRSPSHAWPAKIRFALSLGYNVCMSWQKNPGTCSTKPFLRATQR